jgi:hypothetical protein
MLRSWMGSAWGAFLWIRVGMGWVDGKFGWSSSGAGPRG